MYKGIGDVCDPCPFDAENDIDNDTVCGDLDNCRYLFNPEQLDADNDGNFETTEMILFYF